jgi:hypothetical protein
MKVIATSVSDEELIVLQDRADKSGLTIAAMIRAGLRLPAARRRGRPGDAVKCNICRQLVSISSLAKHRKEHKLALGAA